MRKHDEVEIDRENGGLICSQCGWSFCSKFFRPDPKEQQAAHQTHVDESRQLCPKYAKIEAVDGPLTSFLLAERVRGGYQAGTIFYPDEQIKSCTSMFVTPTDPRLWGRHIERGAEALHDLLTMLGVNPDERPDHGGESIAETLARAVIRGAMRGVDAR